ncbi:unnamed protein product [Parascedosporium putredinis]|uniref:GPI anchored serine-rich protein n=1 Tax=Parascedosporium putredinis TaxID=1442378 RepID=A0A9P1H0H0_9PEZI|nr:unnamed protein product [Parascedosporium putredinis]CAI7992790.1 unnamed protein product [Parascedosporium putredinis]
MYKSAILSVLALCASVVVATEPDTTTTLTATTTLTQTVTLTSCGPEVPDCPIRSTETPEPSEEPSSSIVLPSNNATVVHPTGSKPPSSSVAVQGGLLFAAALLGLVTLN